MKSKIITITITICLIALYMVCYFNKYEEATKANEAYLVYLDDKKIGMIDNDTELYNIINNEQQAIKDKYKVDGVYPPTSFEIIKTNTYDDNYSTVDDIYKKMAKLDNFTVKGYVVTIKFPEEEKKDDLVINVLDKSVFEQAIRNFILAFITEEELNKYVDNEDKTLTEIGSIIQTMYFNETITIKEAYISVNDKIFTDVESLSQYLLFGPDAKMSSYEVQYGDDIESISEAHQLNPQELIIANPYLRGTNTILSAGSKINVTLLNPMITLVCEMYRIEQTETPFTKKTVVDSSKEYGYSEVTQAGVTGLTLNHEYYQVKNGEQSSELKIEKSEQIREAVEQVTTVGKNTPAISISGSYIDTGGSWGWATNQPYAITSGFTWRWGKHHDGIDISGTGYGSPIYSIGDGVVVEAQAAGSGGARWKEGTYVVIQHANNIYSLYAHMSALKVSVGQTVSKGTVIGAMGQTGYAFGTHLHLSVSTGQPYHGSYQFIDPLRLYQ